MPLYQGRTIWQFDHRANSIRFNAASTHNPYLSEPVTEAEHANPTFCARTQYWVPAENVEATVFGTNRWLLGFRDISNPTNARTMVASLIPVVGCGHTLPILVSGDEALNADNAAFIVANLNSVCFDFVTRQKVQGTHLTWYTVEQLPVIAEENYDRTFGVKTAREIVGDHVLRLTYTANDMIPFARDMGYDGPPFIWNEEERRHLRARLDALYFHLYGLSRDDAGYVMDTFPIVRREDMAAFGRYRTRELVLAYMHALDAGDTETVVAL